MKKFLPVLFFLSILFKLATNSSFASSLYVLPYPGEMPGNKLYRIHAIWEKMMSYWYFGNLSQFTYNLKEADLYLVEAKTLFEYNQFLLAVTALQKSNMYFLKLPTDLSKAQQEGKNISQYQITMRQAAEKHEEVLKNLGQSTPISFEWQPEKAHSSILRIHDLIDTAIKIRNNSL